MEFYLTMREIKFKAWSKKLGRFVNPDKLNHNINLGLSSTLIYYDQVTGQFGEEECELVQFTGIKDRNGKEVYEGDIVQCKYHYIPIKWWSTQEEIPEIKKRTEESRKKFNLETNSIKFRYGSFCWGCTPLVEFDIINNMLVEKFERGQTHCNDYEQKWWDFEIIGNVFENPELLNN